MAKDPWKDPDPQAGDFDAELAQVEITRAIPTQRCRSKPPSQPRDEDAGLAASRQGAQRMLWLFVVGLLHRGGFILAAVTKVGAPNGTSRADRYDRWFRYPAGFSASTLTKTFDSVGGKGASDMLFIDPFCGAGTVGTAALARGHRFAGIDAHQLIVELARANLNPPDRPT